MSIFVQIGRCFIKEFHFFHQWTLSSLLLLYVRFNKCIFVVGSQTKDEEGESQKYNRVCTSISGTSESEDDMKVLSLKSQVWYEVLVYNISGMIWSSCLSNIRYDMKFLSLKYQVWYEVLVSEISGMIWSSCLWNLRYDMKFLSLKSRVWYEVLVSQISGMIWSTCLSNLRYDMKFLSLKSQVCYTILVRAKTGWFRIRMYMYMSLSWATC